MQNKAPAQQFSFAAGMLDDTFQARQDSKKYFYGAREIRNMVCLPSGGVSGRGALRLCWEFPEMANGFLLGNFEVSPQIGFLTLFVDKKIHLLSDDKHIELDAPYNGADLNFCDLNQSLDTMLITEEDYQPKSLIRKGSNDSWGLEDTVFEKIPQDTYNDTAGGQNDIQQLKFTSAAAGNSFRLKLSGSKTKSIIWSNDVNANAANIKTALNELDILSGADGGVAVTVNGGEYRVEFIGKDGKKDWEDIIISIEDAGDQCRVYTKCIQDGKPPLENVWSEKRGWPICSSNHGGRLVIGGVRDRPDRAYISNTNRPLLFHMTDELLDDEAFTLPVDSNGKCIIYYTYSAGKLFLFTNKGVFVVTESLMTPSNAIAEKQTSIPCARVKPVELNGYVAYVTQTPNGINQSVAAIIYSDENKKYITEDLAKDAYVVMRCPISMDVRTASIDKNATYLFVVNSDGTLAVLNTDDEELNGWTLCDTPNGEFLGVRVVNDTVYFATKRTIGGETRYFIEEWVDNANLDLSVELTSDTPKRIWNEEEIAFYNGLEVGVYADGLAYGTVKVEDNKIELNYDATRIEVGIPFDWALETMPIVAQLSDGTLIGNRHRFAKTTICFKDSAGVFIQGKQICNRYFGRDCWDKTEVLLNGNHTIRSLGWFGANKDKAATIRCHGTSLQPVTILSITTEVIQ